MSDQALPRRLGLLSATMIVVGGIIGGGIFATPAEVARQLGSEGAIFAVWALGGLVALAGALTYAELGAMMPDAGGPYVYIREAFGELPAFLYGWMLLASIATGADAAIAIFFASYLARFVDLAPVGGAMGLAAGTIVLFTITNILGVRPGAWVQNALTLAKTAALALLIVLGLAMWTRIGSPPPYAAPAPRASLLAGLAAAFVPVLFSVGGWQQMNMVAGEIRAPRRLLQRALFLGIGIVVAVYL
ncbi:MAG TPA: amino acid permease, partial [Gemmatimonadaceae bacterium]|nr:amino acid permease [Gemmatimonadaceae bacterium]